MTTSLAPTSPEFGKLKQLASQIVSHKQWDAALIVSLGGSLAAEANKLTSLSGSQKKQLVLDVVKNVLNEFVKAATDVSEEKQKQLEFVVESVLPASLDLAVAAARGKFDLKKTKKTLFASCLRCIPVLVSAVGGSQSQANVVIQAVEKVAEKVDPELVQVETKAEPSSQVVEEAEKKVEQTETPQQVVNPEVVLEPREDVNAPPTDDQKA